MSKNKKTGIYKYIIGVCIALVVIGAIVIVAAVINKKGNYEAWKEEPNLSGYSEEDIVTVDGVKYVPRNNIESYLFMGIDAEGKVKKRKEYDGTGQCDTLMLLVIDKTQNTYTVLSLDRNTIVPVRSLTIDGQDLGVSDLQLSLAHSMGDGLEMSCENTVEAVSQLLNGRGIEGYIALNLDGIALINNKVGGVMVTIEDDFSKCDKTLKMGETIRLNDEQAVHFIRNRMDVADGSNENRIKRQNTYIDAIKPMLIEKSKADETFPVDLYQSLSDYIVSDLSNNEISRISKALIKNEDLGTIKIKGTNSVDEYGFTAFNIDKKNLEQVMIKLFYKKIPE